MPRPILRLGSRGTPVADLQRLLNLGLQPAPKIRPDGSFGKATHDALCRFQQQAGLTADGVVGLHTWEALEGAVAKAPKIKPAPGAPAKPPGTAAKLPGAAGGPMGPPAPGPSWLPAKGAAAKLSDADFAAAAADLGVEEAAIRAVARVESGGRSGFDASGRPKLLFEAAIFHKRTHGKYHQSHPHLSQPTWALAKQYYTMDQWQRLHDALRLEEDAALKSASYGMFQIMGFNYEAAGWESVKEFVVDMHASEGNHLKAFLGFCKANHLVQHLKSKDWASFARGYNGPGYAQNHYDVKLKQAYDQYSKKKG